MYLQDAVPQRFCPTGVSSKLETLVAVAEHLEEGLDLVEQVVVVGGKDDVGNVPGRGPGFHCQAVPIIEAHWAHSHPLPLVTNLNEMFDFFLFVLCYFGKWNNSICNCVCFQP